MQMIGGKSNIKKVWCRGERRKERSFKVIARTGSKEAAGGTVSYESKQRKQSTEKIVIKGKHHVTPQQ